MCVFVYVCVLVYYVYIIECVYIPIHPPTHPHLPPPPTTQEHEGYTLLRNQLQRIAGMHVQHAATVGGNLMLARTRHFESDVLTPLLALGALVHVAYPGAHPTTTVTDASSTEATPLTNTAGEQVGTMHMYVVGGGGVRGRCAHCCLVRVGCTYIHSIDNTH